MKSIIEEASSISKAIENAWKRAEQPEEFSVRIFETPQKNMFGFTTKSAKIGFFFEDAKPKDKARPNNNRPKTKPEPRYEAKPVVAPAPQKIEQKPAPVKQRREITESEPWSPEMVTTAQNWFDDLFKQLPAARKNFKIEPQKYHLKVSFEAPVFEQEEKNRAFFRNCAYLVLQAVRNANKRPLKGFKVIVTSE